MAFWFRWGGILLGAMSLFSLIQKLYGFGLAPVFKHFVAFYRAAFYPLADIIIGGMTWLFALAGLRLPQISSDIIVIYVLVGAAFFRYALIYAQRKRRAQEIIYIDIDLPDEVKADYTRLTTASLSKITRLEIGFIFIFSLLWPVAILISPFVSTGSLIHRLPLISFRSWTIEVCKVIGAFIMLFATNAYFSI
jgi:hypothetical protein